MQVINQKKFNKFSNDMNCENILNCRDVNSATNILIDFTIK